MVLIAERVSNDLAGFTPGPHPDRPVDLPVKDETIYAAVECAATMSRPSAEDVDIARRFAAWKLALMDAEGVSRSRLQLLVGCWETLCMEGNGDPVLDAAADRISTHIAHWWPSCDLRNLPPQNEPAARDLFMSGSCRRDDLCPSWLLYRGRPPSFIPGAQGRSNHWSDDD